MDDRRQRRMTQNEARARHINDTIEHERPLAGDSAESFICECVHGDCEHMLDLAIGQYMSVRSHPRRFVVLPGHEEPAIESIVEIHPDYVVVQKRGKAGRLAEAEAVGQVAPAAAPA